jgi:hypothetical protein
VSLQVFATLATLATLGCSSAASNDQEPDEPCSDEQGAAIEVGRLEAKHFTPFAAGDPIAVIHGVQGGQWMMPSLRFVGVLPNGSLHGDLALTDGQMLGTSRLPALKMARAEDGSFHLQYLPVPVGTAPGSPAADDVDGERAVLTVRYDFECGALEHEQPLILDVLPP